MSRIPFLDRLGDSLETAVAGRTEGARRGPLWVASTAFFLVLVAGGVWLLVRPGDESVTETSAASTSVASDPDPIDVVPVGGGPLPSVWARVPHQASLEGRGRISLSGVTVWRGGYVAVGSDIESDGSGSAGVVLTSSDGVTWAEVARYEDVSLHDVAVGDAGLAAVGMRFDASEDDALPAAVVVTSDDGTGWSTASDLPVGPPATSAQASAVVGWEGGFVAGGVETEVGSETAPWRFRPALWLSPDGRSWSPTGGQPEFYVEASVEGLGVADGSLVAVGLISETEGFSHPAVWVSTDGEEWDLGEVVRTDGVSGFSGMSAVALGEQGLVAVGFAQGTAGTAGAVWTAMTAGGPWKRLPDPEGLFGEGSSSSTRVHGVAGNASGYIAVGLALERPFGNYVLWTSADGESWRRFLLDDPGRDDGMVGAFAVASGDDRIVVVGSSTDLAGVAGSGAVWVGPAPPGSVPSVAVAESDPGPGSAALSIEPSRAVAATRVLVRGRIPEGSEAGEGVVVSLVAAGGERITLCEAPLVASRFECRARLGEAAPGLAEGVYRIVADGLDEGSIDVEIEVLPEGSTVVTLSSIYNRTLWPLLQSLSVRNHGAEPLDLEGWLLADNRRVDAGYSFPAGTIVEPGSSLIIDFGGPGGGICPEATPRYIHWCHIAGDGSRIDFADGQLLWQGGDVELTDPEGGAQATWSPPR